MGMMDKLKKRMQERTAEISRMAGDLTRLKADRDQLEAEINTAIDNGQTGQAEQLVNKRRELDVKIEVMERTISRKTEKYSDRAEIVEAANKEISDYQRKIDQAQTALLAAKKAYLSQLIDLGIMVNEAWNTRTEYCSLVDGIEDPTTDNVQTRDFIGISAVIKWDRLDNELLKEINPAALEILGNAIRDRHNRWIGRDNSPIRPDVIIDKH